MRDEFGLFATREMGINENGLSKYIRNTGKHLGLGTSIIKESDMDNCDTMNVFTRLMADRIIYFGETVTEDTANILMAQLLYLDTVDNSKPITMFINSPGGFVIQGLGIYDMMHHITAPVYTTCTAQAASMGAIILSSGERGHREAFRHSRIMIHELWGGCEGKFHDIQSNAKYSQTLHDDLCLILSENTGKPVKEIEEACRTDFWMRSSEAVDFGLIDKVIE